MEYITIENREGVCIGYVTIENKEGVYIGYVIIDNKKYKITEIEGDEFYYRDEYGNAHAIPIL